MPTRKLCPDRIKLELRRQEWINERNHPSRCFAEAKERAWTFWTEYEQVNRDFCPDDPVYSIANVAGSLVSTSDFLGFTSPASGQIRILDLLFGGEGTASTHTTRLSVVRTSSVGGGTIVTPEKFNSRSPAAAGAYRSNVNSITVTGNPLLVMALNSFGAFIRWFAAPCEEVYAINGEILGLTKLTNGVGGSVTSVAVFEEL
jgi:hypothetical protein